MRYTDPALLERLEKLINSMGYELLGIEQMAQGGSTLLRIYIDKEQGVTVDDCATVSRQLGATLDVEAPLAGLILWKFLHQVLIDHCSLWSKWVVT